MNNQKEEIKDLDKIEPIDYGVIAKPHTPVYKMHRYFARRPYTVFNELIKHYSNPGSIILDPMCGGGVTIVEGLNLRRKVIGVDLNPIAIFISRLEAMDVEVEKIKKAFYDITENIKQEIRHLYLTKCPKCQKQSPAEWLEWSNIFQCQECRTSVVLAKVKKLRWGTYVCENYPRCSHEVNITTDKKLGEIPIQIKLQCDYCGKTSIKEPDKFDLEKAEYFEKNFSKIVKQRDLWFPKDKMPQDYELRRPYNREFKCFTDFIQKRNLLALSILFKAIEALKSKEVKIIFEGIFCSTLNWSCRMCVLKKGSPAGWPAANYWTQNRFLEINVWDAFYNRYLATLKGKQYSKEYLGTYPCEVLTFDKLQKEGNLLLLNKSATSLSEIPSNSVDAIITDPPYGGNVMYSELCNFFAIWIKRRLRVPSNALIDDTKEAIISRPHQKGLKEYRNLMYKIFEECYRVLKPNRWVVMTFHNREFQVWNAIHLAAHDAGFIWSEKDGMIYQPPIQQYTTTIYLYRAGSMLGDFILSYRKSDKLPEEKLIEEVEIGNKIRKIAKDAIEYHGGAKLSTIYMRLMPFLLNSGLLEKIKENDVETYLRKDFIKRDDKWYLKEFIDEKTGGVKDITIEEYAPVKARIESIIRRFLAQGKKVAMDEILEVVYARLINGNAAEYEEIAHVINRICVKIKGEGERALYQLKEEKDKGLLFEMVKEKIEYSEESDHDVIIEQLVKIGKTKGYESHVGQTEQKKDKRFREISLPMGSNVQYGLNQMAFNRIKEIDILWLKGVEIVAAFEVEKSTTIDSGITRFRELFAATPSLKIPAYIVIPDKRKKETEEKIGSLANRRDGLTERIKYILFSDLIDKEDINLDKISKEVK